MKENQTMDKEALFYAKQVHNQMHGFYLEGTVPGVRDESEDGFSGKYYEEIHAALKRLGTRGGFDTDDEDVVALLDALEQMLKESDIKMFGYGVEYAKNSK